MNTFAIENMKLLRYTGHEKHLDLSEEIEEIGEGAFKECTDLESVLIPWTVRKIGREAFAGCTSLKDVYICGAVEIQEDAFRDCVSIQKFFIPYGTLVIDQNAFKGCTGLQRIYYSGQWQYKRSENGSVLHDFLPVIQAAVYNNLHIETVSYPDLVNGDHFEYWDEIIEYFDRFSSRYENACRIQMDTDPYSLIHYDLEQCRKAKQTVIGCGTSGGNAVYNLSSPCSCKHLNSYENVFYIFMDLLIDNPELYDTPQHIGMWGSHSGGLGGRSPENAVSDLVDYMIYYLPVVRNSRELILVGMAGGGTCAVLMRIISLTAKRYGIPVKAILTFPISPEKTRLSERAENLSSVMKRMIREENVIEIRVPEVSWKQENFERGLFYVLDSKRKTETEDAVHSLLRKDEADSELMDRLFLKKYVSRESLSEICRIYDRDWLENLDESVFLRMLKLITEGNYTLKEDKIVKYLYLFGIREESLFRKMEEYRDAFNRICSEDLPELLDSCFRYKY